MDDNSVKILLIEDSLEDTHLIGQMLAEARNVRFDLEHAERLSTGLACLTQGGIDLILLDLSLPDSDGLDTFVKIKAEATEVPIVLLVGLDDEARTLEAMQAGAQDYLVKRQFESDTLERVVRYAIERQRLVTERVWAEEALQKSEREYRNLVDNALVGIYKTNLKGDVLYGNEAIARIFEFETPEEFISAGAVARYKHLEDRTAFIKKLKQTGRIESIELEMVTKTGATRQVLLSAVLDGENIEGMIVDITRRKQVEKESRLKDELLQRTGEMAKVGGWEFDAQTLQGTWTDEVARIHDLDPDQPTNVELGLSFYLPGSREKIDRAVQEAIELAKPYDLELEMVSATGAHKWVRTMGLPITSGGKVIKVRGIFQDITERKRQEEELLATKNLLEKTFASLNEAVLVVNPADRTIVLCNPAVEHIFGYSVDELIGKNTAILHVNQEAYDYFAQIGEPILEESGIFQTEFEMRRRDGQIIVTENTVTTLIDIGGWASGVVSVIRDITERKRAEETLRESEQRYSAIFDKSPIAIALTKMPEGTTVSVNDAFLKLFEFTRAEVIGKTSVELGIADPDSRAQIAAELQARDSVRYFEATRTTKSGTRRVLSLNLDWVSIGGEKHVLTTISDITERNQIEAEIRRRNRELTLLNQVIAASASGQEPEAVLEIACRELALAFDLPQTTATLLNPEKTATQVVAEYRAEGRPSALGNTIPTVGNPAIQHLLKYEGPLVVTEAQRDPRLGLLHDLLHEAGIVSLLILPLRINGEVIGSLSLESLEPYVFSTEEVNLAWSVVDEVAGVLARAQLSQEHRRLEEQYYQAQKMEAVGQLTAGIAHDFNNLIMAINGNAEVMQMQIRPKDPLYAMTSTIMHAGSRAADLIRQLLIFSRKQIMAPQIVELNAVITEMNRLLGRIIGENIEVKLNLAPDLWPVKVDPAQIEQVTVNLAVNARDAMPEGGRLILETANMILDEAYTTGHFEVQPGEYVLLTVSDTGVGMSREVQARLFEPFFTTKGAGKGTGLGLATVYGIVKQSGGHIWVYSEEGQGSTFKVYLPRTTEIVAPSLPSPSTREMKQGHETILVVEDDTAIRTLARDVLKKQGYTVLEAENSEQALQVAALRAGPLNLLLTDVIMPGMSGKALAEEMAERYPELKVIYMSGYSDEVISHHGMLEPGIVLLQKPFSFMEMVRKVQEVLDQ